MIKYQYKCLLSSMSLTLSRSKMLLCLCFTVLLASVKHVFSPCLLLSESLCSCKVCHSCVLDKHLFQSNCSYQQTALFISWPVCISNYAPGKFGHQSHDSLAQTCLGNNQPSMLRGRSMCDQD